MSAQISAVMNYISGGNFISWLDLGTPQPEKLLDSHSQCTHAKVITQSRVHVHGPQRKVGDAAACQMSRAGNEYSKSMEGDHKKVVQLDFWIAFCTPWFLYFYIFFEKLFGPRRGSLICSCMMTWIEAFYP